MKKSKIPMMLLALAASIFLWLYVVTVIDPNDSVTIYSIPITLENTDRLETSGLMVTEGRQSVVTLKFTGRRSSLKKLKKEDITISTDVSRVKLPGETALPYSVSLPDSITSGGVVVSEKSPEQITLQIVPVAEKTVPVKVNLENEISEGYMADMELLQTDPEAINITGPADIVAQIETAQVTIDVGTLTETVNASYAFDLVDADGNAPSDTYITPDVSAVNVVLPVEKYKEIPVVLDLVEGGGATKESVEMELSPAYITISGEEAAVDAMESLDLGSLNLAEILEDKELTFEIQLPDGVKSVSGETQVMASIRISGLSTKEVEVETFRLSNLDDAFQATVKTTVLQVTIRGPTADINRVDEAELQAVADMSEINKSGTYVLPITIVSEAYPDIGAIGSASITVSVE